MEVLHQAVPKDQVFARNPFKKKETFAVTDDESLAPRTGAGVRVCAESEVLPRGVRSQGLDVRLWGLRWHEPAQRSRGVQVGSCERRMTDDGCRT